MSIKGFPIEGRQEDLITDTIQLKQKYATLPPKGVNRRALDTMTGGVFEVTAAAVVEAGSTNSIVNLTAHGAKVGDMIRVLTSANSIDEYEMFVDSIISANSFQLAGVCSADFAAGDTIDLLRYVTEKFGPNGETLAAVTVPPVQYELDGANQTVTKDTVTPANTRALPVSIVDVTGVDATFNVTTGDLNIATTHNSIPQTYDSMRIGDGTELLAINASNEAQVRDDDLNAKLPATIGQKARAASLAVAWSTEDQAILDSLVAKFGTIGQQARAASAAVTLSTEDVAVLSAMSAKLPTAVGQLARAASMSSTWSTEDQAIMDAFSAKFGTIGQQARAASAAVTLSTEDITILSNMSAKLPAALGQLARAASMSTTWSTEDQAIIDAMSAKLPATLGSKADAASLAVTQSTEDKAVLAAMSAKLPAALGQTTTAASMAVTLPNDMAPLEASSMDNLAFSLTDITGVTNAAYTEIMADTGGNAAKRIKMFMSSGVSLFLAIGAAASEVDKMIIPPGGFPDGYIDVIIPANSRLSVKAYTGLGPVAGGDLIINVMG